MGTGRARMKTPMRAHSPPINCTLKMVKLVNVMGMVVLILLKLMVGFKAN